MKELQKRFENRAHLKPCPDLSQQSTQTPLLNPFNEENINSVPFVQNFYATYSVVEPWFKLFSTVTFADPTHLSAQGDEIYTTRGVALIEHWSNLGHDDWYDDPGEYSVLQAPFSFDQKGQNSTVGTIAVAYNGT